MAKSIRERVDKHKDNIRKWQGNIDIERAKIRVIQEECRQKGHPGQYETSCMGDNGTHCPNCGYST